MKRSYSNKEFVAFMIPVTLLMSVIVFIMVHWTFSDDYQCKTSELDGARQESASQLQANEDLQRKLSSIAAQTVTVTQTVTTTLPAETCTPAIIPQPTCNQRYIFIDLGANSGDTFKVFLGKPDAPFVHQFAAPEHCTTQDSEVYLFEANPKFNADLVRIKEQYKSDTASIQVYPSTPVWYTDGIMEFYVQKYNDHAGGSSLVGTARDIVNDRLVFNLTTVDIAKFILQNFLPEDFVVIKMDIEAAEYFILPHLVKMQAYINIDVLYCEFHAFDNPTKEMQDSTNEAVEILKAAGVKMPTYDTPM